MIFAEVIVLLGILMLFWMLIEQKLLLTKQYVVEMEQVPDQFQNTKYVILSDLHSYVFGKQNQRIYNRIKKLSPDYILIAGDMVNKDELCYPGNAFSLLERLAKEYPVYYAYGNHESRLEQLHLKNQEDAELFQSWIKYKELLTEQGIIFLNNQDVILSRGKDQIRITGLSLNQRFFERCKAPVLEMNHLKSLIGDEIKKGDNRNGHMNRNKLVEHKTQVNPSADRAIFELLIAHNPVYFKEYAAWGANLTISGHIHGGLMRLPWIGGVISPQVQLFPKYDAGLFHENGAYMIVSRGLGSHSIMPRIFNPPEVVMVTLKKKVEGI